MEHSLKNETEKLTRSWSQHEPGWLRDYLVAGVEDPRINLQSILSRHFLIRALEGVSASGLMDEEYRFSSVMNWLVDLAGKSADVEDLESLSFALERGSDNAEGIEILPWVTHIFASLPRTLDGRTIPNYVASFLAGTSFEEGKAVPHQGSLNTFCDLWRQELAPRPEVERGAAPLADRPRLRVLEPACGSANDFRYFAACGLGEFLEYTGFDLCPANVENAQKLFPAVHFEVGNVFEIAAADKSFDFCVVHDLFEHLSLEGMQVAIREVCRVTRRCIAAGFFQMDEIPEHIVRPVDEYHWNLLSASRTRRAFAELGFGAQMFHIPTFLRARTGCDRYHNPNAYSFWLEPVPPKPSGRL